MKKKFNLLYYSNAFIASHGGRLHSEAFLKETKKNTKVNKIRIFPAPMSRTNPSKSVDSGVRKLLKSFSIFQVLFFYRRNIKSYKEIVPVLKENKVDCIHIRLDSNFLIIKKLKQLFPNLIITTEVNASPFDENFNNIGFLSYFKKLEYRSLEQADANFFVSDNLRKGIMKKPLVIRDFVVHNGVDLDLFKPNTGNETMEVITFGYVGTLDFHKNLKTLIDAFEIIYKQNVFKVKLLLVGDGPMFNDLTIYIKQKDIDEAIEFTGWVEHQNIVEQLWKMDIAIHHSANPYMSPLKIFEYMAVGLPVIGPDIPAVREIFKDGEDLVLVKNEVDDIVDKMLFFLKNNDKRKNISQRGMEKIRSQYGWKNNVDTILTVIQNKHNENN